MSRSINAHPDGRPEPLLGSMAGLWSRLRQLRQGRGGSGSGQRATADADGAEDLWDPRGVPDPITIALGGSAGRVIRGQWFQRGAGPRIGR